MSRNTFSSLLKFPVFVCAILCLAALGTSTSAIAQGFLQPKAYSVVGMPNTKVNASGSVVGQVGLGACPYDNMDLNKMKAAFDAAKGGDPDSCPHALATDGEKIYFESCGGVYRNWARMAAGVLNPEMDMNLLGCEYPPGAERNRIRNREKTIQFMSKTDDGFLSKLAQVPPIDPTAWSSKDYQDLNKKKQEKEQAEKQCFDDTLQRVSEYWANKRATSCIRNGSRLIQNFLTVEVRKMKNSMQEKIATGFSSTQNFGIFGNIFSLPSFTGIGQVIGSIAGFAAEIISIASQASDFLNALSEECGNMLPQLRELQEWRKGVMGNICRAAETLVERQLTQCIRVNIGGGGALKLPQFNVALQCPVNINFTARLTPRGFDCFGSATVGSPIIAGTGRRSVSGGNGGLENLFDGKCFTSPTSRADGGFATSAGTGTGTGSSTESGSDRVPGVDCGPLDPDTRKAVPLQGKGVWTAGFSTNGWAAGKFLTAKSTPSGVTPVGTSSGGGTIVTGLGGTGVITSGLSSTITLSSGLSTGSTISSATSETINGLQISRCDMYDAGRPIRTVYVFGDASSCHTGPGAFVSGGYETNTACYGGYVPAPKPSIPDACMYDEGCLDSNGKFDRAKAGTGSCPSADPIFNASRTYMKFVAGGFGGGDDVTRSCKDFDGEVSMPVICCDPQKQDCRERDPGTPLCNCTEGDASNKVKTDLLTGGPVENGMCEQSGTKTCCSPRLNGGKEVCETWRTTENKDLAICASEEMDQCTELTNPATYVRADGQTKTITIAEAAQAKPSPYLYLFIRPDVEVKGSGQQCCTTEWCNVCPQHYVNAYGLSLKREAGYMDPKSDADNNKLIGKGWPFVLDYDPNESGDEDGSDSDTGDTYRIGISEVPGLVLVKSKKNDGNKEKEEWIAYRDMALHIADMMKAPASIAACNTATGLKAQMMPMMNFGNGRESMGFSWNKERKKKRQPRWAVSAGVPEPTKYPIDYLNDLRRNIRDAQGTPLPPIPLCSDVQMCMPESQGTVLPPALSTNTGKIKGDMLGTGTLFVTPGATARQLNPVRMGTVDSMGDLNRVLGPTVTPGLGGSGTLTPGVVTPSVPVTPGVVPSTPTSPSVIPPAGGAGSGLAPATGAIGLF